jgi:hypothetical protein
VLREVVFEWSTALMRRCKRATCMRRYDIYVKKFEECSNFDYSSAARVVMRI